MAADGFADVALVVDVDDGLAVGLIGADDEGGADFFEGGLDEGAGGEDVVADAEGMEGLGVLEGEAIGIGARGGALGETGGVVAGEDSGAVADGQAESGHLVAVRAVRAVDAEDGEAEGDKGGGEGEVGGWVRGVGSFLGGVLWGW